MSIKVRNAARDDARQIAEIHVAAWQAAYQNVMSVEFLGSLTVSQRETMWSGALSTPGKGSYLVGEVDSAIQGFCVFGPSGINYLDGGAGELLALNVHPEYWGKGIGGALVQKTLKVLKNEACESVFLWVVEGNLRAIELYERFGFRNSDIKKVDTAHSGDPITELRFEVSLSNRV